MLTVELLGPLRVSVAGRTVELPAGRLRALLAVLAMSAGRTVPTERLATAVWGTDSRGDPRVNVRTNVKRLRRALGTAGELLIAARPGGYLLTAEPDHVDVLRFGRLLDAATAAPDPTTERSRLATALTTAGATSVARPMDLSEPVSPLVGALQYLPVRQRPIDARRPPRRDVGDRRVVDRDAERVAGPLCRRVRLLRTAANGSPAFAQYRPSGTGNGFDPWALQVL